MGRHKAPGPTRRDADSDCLSGEDILAGTKRNLPFARPLPAAPPSSLSSSGSSDESEDSGDDEVVAVTPVAKRPRREIRPTQGVETAVSVGARAGGSNDDGSGRGVDGNSNADADPQGFLVSDADSEEPYVPRRRFTAEPATVVNAASVPACDEAANAGKTISGGAEDGRETKKGASGARRGRSNEKGARGRGRKVGQTARNGQRAVNSFLRSLGSGF
jgi:hypothetical protein